MIALLIIIYVFIPVLIIFLCNKYQVLNKIGAVILAYIIGIVLGHVGILPRPGEFLEKMLQSGGKPSVMELEHWVQNGLISSKEFLGYKIFKLQDLLTSIAIPVALPLLLFSLNIRNWVRMSGKTFLSMLLAIVGAVFFIVLGYHVFGSDIDNSKNIAGMLVGLYTGGTPNLASLKEMLGVDAETYIITHTYDTVVSVVYLLFIISIGKYIFRSFMKPYPKRMGDSSGENNSFSEKAYSGFFSKESLKDLAIALGIALVILIISGALALMVPPESLMLVVILSITTLSIAVSFIPFVNRLKKTFEFGMYFIIVFSLVVASMADIHKLVNISADLFLYITFVVFGSFVLHALLCKLFKVDADTFMVTSTALICSPPFVPMVAEPLGNKEVIVSGLTVGIVGYAIGNYLGVTLVAFL